MLHTAYGELQIDDEVFLDRRESSVGLMLLERTGTISRSSQYCLRTQ